MTQEALYSIFKKVSKETLKPCFSLFFQWNLRLLFHFVKKHKTLFFGTC